MTTTTTGCVADASVNANKARYGNANNLQLNLGAYKDDIANAFYLWFTSCIIDYDPPVGAENWKINQTITITFSEAINVRRLILTTFLIVLIIDFFSSISQSHMPFRHS